jgi:hypothetical protein
VELARMTLENNPVDLHVAPRLAVARDDRLELVRPLLVQVNLFTDLRGSAPWLGAAGAGAEGAAAGGALSSAYAAGTLANRVAVANAAPTASNRFFIGPLLPLPSGIPRIPTRGHATATGRPKDAPGRRRTHAPPLSHVDTNTWTQIDRRQCPKAVANVPRRSSMCQGALSGQSPALPCSHKILAIFLRQLSIAC